MSFLSRRYALLTLATTAATPLVSLRAQPHRAHTLADALAGEPRFARFLDLVVGTGVVETLRAHGPMTVFAPVNEAFTGAGATQMQLLFAGATGGWNQQAFNDSAVRDRISNLVRAHIVEGSISAAELAGAGARGHTLAGGEISITSSGGTSIVRNPAMASQMQGFFARAGHQMSSEPAQILGPAIPASNGMIYPVSQIIWP